MAEENNAALALADVVQGGPVAKYSEKDFAKVASTGDYLPYVILATANAKIVVSDQVPKNHFVAIKGDTITDFGKTLLCWALAWRPKAMDLNGEIPMSYFDPDTEIFQKIKTESFGQNSKKMFGPEYLLWIPGYGWAGLFMGSKTSRNEAKNIQAAVPKAACVEDGKEIPARLAKPLALTSKLIKTTEYTWQGIVANVSDQAIDTPPVDEFKEQLDKFGSPKDSEVKVAAPKDAAAADRG